MHTWKVILPLCLLIGVALGQGKGDEIEEGDGTNLLSFIRSNSRPGWSWSLSSLFNSKEDSSNQPVDSEEPPSETDGTDTSGSGTSGGTDTTGGIVTGGDTDTTSDTGVPDGDGTDTDGGVIPDGDTDGASDVGTFTIGGITVTSLTITLTSVDPGCSPLCNKAQKQATQSEISSSAIRIALMVASTFTLLAAVVLIMVMRKMNNRNSSESLLKEGEEATNYSSIHV